MAYSIKPSIGMLPLVDLSNALESEGFVKNLSTKDIEDATTVERIIDDVSVVLPGIANAENIAVSTGQVIDGQIDRETVRNALNLNGIPGEQYLKSEDKDEIVENAENLNQNFANEIQLLRDELYMLKGELVKTGHISDTSVAKGFIDGFKTSNIKYSVESTTIESVDALNIRQTDNLFEKDEWLAIKKSKLDDDTVVVGKVIKELGNDIQVNVSTANMSVENSLLFRSLGEYRNGTYSFSRTLYDVAGVKERYTMLNDDVDLRQAAINKNATGFTTSIRIPSRNSGFLSKLILQGKKFGNPGALVCYVIEGDADDIKALGKFGKITEMIDNETYLAKSLPVYEVESDGEIIFNFINVNGEDNRYPEVIGAKEYSFVVKASTATRDDYWSFEFGLNKGGDLQTNNSSFIFNEQKENTNEPEIVEFDDARDMFYTVITRDKEEKSEFPYKEGLYTVAKSINIPKNYKGSRARLTLEVNKEGKFITSNQGTIRAELDAVEFTQTNGSTAEQTVISGGDYVVIGDSIAQVKTSTPGTITIDRNIYVDSGTPIYRCGYEAQLIVRRVVEDETTKEPIIEEGSQKCYKLNLAAVIPSDRGIESPITDRLIFEISFKDAKELEDFNQAELQIKWKSNLSQSIMKTQLLKGNDYVGRIHGMSLVFDEII